MKWFEKLAKKLESEGRHRMIWRDNKPYLERFYVFSSKWLGIYLHRFWSSDDDGLHSHPWRSISILISGGYFEEEPAFKNKPFGPIEKRYRTRFRPFFKIRSLKDIHRITIPKKQEGKCWSVFIRFGFKRKIWGFFRNGQFEKAEIQSREDLL